METGYLQEWVLQKTVGLGLSMSVMPSRYLQKNVEEEVEQRGLELVERSGGWCNFGCFTIPTALHFDGTDSALQLDNISKGVSINRKALVLRL